MKNETTAIETVEIVTIESTIEKAIDLALRGLAPLRAGSRTCLGQPA
jgi:hypothetical protein